ncbi:SDR family NAD(P)-dependent oxidoreductase, partial [Enhygromyxa salina]|uniref:SDR family NAD(P)-dependent oxidoreductase n=1 Tax=Enhygromyxa salina TaxID=215803 RepID=UPI0011BA8F56
MSDALVNKKRSVLAKLLRASPTDLRGDEIAIVGLAGRYPEAPTLDHLWANLLAGRESISELPLDRFDWRRWYDPDPSSEGQLYTARCGVLEDADKFDPLFFNISPREARSMDPQERVFLEVAWAALEDAGHPPSSLAARDDRVGVFVGAMNNGYASLGANAWARGVTTGARSALWSIANRLSYLCNFRGPSLGVDTACSASLTAIHLACESLRHGECELAIAGGVNLITHPLQLIGLCGVGMLSPQGHCRSFGEGADGFVDGEGAGAVVLRPLARALAERDHVWGVIRGSSLNAGGKTSGYTVPNPNAQAACVREALDRARVDPQSISYVEAHGTGTALGDPIEVAGLNLVFGSSSQPVRALGSIKANVGHLESAAGVCGLTRVLLQLRHRTLAPTINADPPNHRIAFAGSTFELVHAARAWTRPTLDGVEQPLRAGLSSFGAGGANAHLVIEESHDPLAALDPAIQGPYLLLLSARTHERLIAVAANMRAQLEVDSEAARELGRTCYTLAVGREPMAARLAVVAASAPALARAIAAFIAGEDPPQLVCAHQVRAHDRGPAPTTSLGPGLDAAALLDWGRWWTLGGEPQWSRLYPGPPRRISLPTYPFARERYWIDIDEENLAAVPPRSHVHIHANDWRLREHQIHGRAMLPAAAVIDLLRERVPDRTIEQLELLAPLQPKPGADLELELRRVDGSKIELIADGQTRARARLGTPDTALDSAAGPRLDLVALQARCRRVEGAFDPYVHFAAAGIAYGPAFRLLRALWVGEGECLVQLGPETPPPPHATTWAALLDAGFQSVFALANAEAGALLIPHTIERVQILGAATATAWVHVQTQADSALGFDLRVAEPGGRVIAEVHGLKLRPRADPGVAAAPSSIAISGVTCEARPATPTLAAPQLGWVLCAKPQLTAGLRAAHPEVEWIQVAPGASFEALDAGRFVIDPVGSVEALVDRLDAAGALPQLILDGLHDDLAQPPATANSLAAHPRLILRLLKALQARAGSPSSLRLLSWSHQAQPDHLALAAAFASLRGEWTGFSGRVLTLDNNDDTTEAIVARLASEWQDGGPEVRVEYSADQRWAPSLAERAAIQADDPTDTAARSWLITGGAGGLGFTLARHLARRDGARLLLCGRSELDPEIAAKLAQLRALGASADYQRCDLRDPDAVAALVAACTSRGGLDGILHCAGVLADGRLLDKTEPELEQVIGVKRLGALHLDQASADLPLRHFVLCSSIASVFGNPGQVAYAYANAFLDHFAAHRDSQRHAGRRSGSTCAINWPALDVGGMQVSAASRRRMRRELGLEPLDAHACARVFERALVGSEVQLVAL